MPKTIHRKPSVELTPLDLIEHLFKLGFDDIRLGLRSTAVKTKQSVSGFIVSSLLCQPPRRVRKNKHADQEGDSGNNLDRKRDTPLAGVVKELAAVSDPDSREGQRGTGGARKYTGNLPIGKEESPNNHQLRPTREQTSGVRWRDFRCKADYSDSAWASFCATRNVLPW